MASDLVGRQTWQGYSSDVQSSGQDANLRGAIPILCCSPHFAFWKGHKKSLFPPLIVVLMAVNSTRFYGWNLNIVYSHYIT